ncbi:6-hydroxy-D-nicotine oxidase [Truncatella angustata]|uniref:6-hydroxy-D-nicotine oxidase n=1 Tax=Truncatella angustata TaxID=152316 RepID=A0A9P9A1H9_9PEZI|nr:6-hydroxy-D-nicotine oxidase [Truncatella angustata]KAH6658353.1 6-hydroxy-D-nicotine oxidase [Truncatella angustata]
MRSLIPLLALHATVPTVAALCSNYNMTGPSIDETCTVLEDAGINVYRANSTTYAAREADYYSVSARMNPSCIAMPISVEHVSYIIKTLTATATTNWAVRCGGHMAWGPAADIHDGITIDLGLMNQTKYDVETKVAKIQGGSLWSDVYTTLEQYGATAPGGRTSTVGVGGFTLGGGNNFYSGKVGFTCDNVVNYEVVLSNGEIVEANSSHNADLWKALKGGSSNFGVVTRFDVQAFDAGNLYGGLVIHPLNLTGQVITAFSNFVDNIVNYQVGSAFSFWSWVQGATESVIISALHDTTGAVDAPAYAEYNAIEPVLSSTLREDSHLNFTKELEFAKGNQNVWFAITVKNDPETLQYIIDQHNAFIPAWQEATGDETFSLYTVFQPLPTILFDHGAEKGGNVLGMDRQRENSVLFQVFMVFRGAGLEPEARARLVAYREAVRARSIEAGTDVDFAYLNYADKTQDPIGTYGDENIAFLREASAKYDPGQILQDRLPGGFKLPRADLSTAGF